MSTKHTPEPWVVHGHHIESATTGFWIADAIAAFPEHSETQNENARRIVACVNSCEGISTENLEENKPVAWLAKKYNEHITQRDALMKALLAISEESTDYEARKHALDAIAKATGEQA